MIDYGAFGSIVDLRRSPRFESLETNPIPGRLSAFRTLLDFRVARRAYRALRAAYRTISRCARSVWEVGFADEHDRDWIVGLALISGSVAILVAIVRPW